MKKEILEHIDMLVEMSGSTNSYENLHEEFLTVTQDIEQKKNQLKRLKKSIGSSKYMKSNEKIIDENIKIGMENRLAEYKDSMNDLLHQIDEMSSKEEKIHFIIVSCEKDLAQIERYIESLDLKMKTSHSKNQTYQNYQSLLDDAFREKEDISKKLSEAEKKYSEITKSLAMLGNQRMELETKISFHEDKLREIENMLANPSTYVDKKAQKKDEELIDQYTSELEELEKRKLEILTDPSYIGHEAQELYLDGETTSALEKIRELVTIVETQPYMNTSLKEIDSILAEAEQRRDEFASEIENKKYDGSDLSILQTRISYLEHEVELEEKEKKKQEDFISYIDMEEVPKLVSHVAEAKTVRDSLKADIESYKQVLEENQDMKSPKKRASMQAALKKKQDELVLVEKILEHFEADLETKIIQSKELEESSFSSQRIEALNAEIASIKKDMALNSRGKDILAVEKDKDELKHYNDIVSDLLHRKKYHLSPREILKQIEQTIEPHQEDKEDEAPHEEPLDLSAYTIDYLPDEMDETPVEESKIDVPSNEIEEDKEEVASLDEIFQPSLEEVVEEKIEPREEVAIESHDESFKDSTLEQTQSLEDIIPHMETEPAPLDFPTLDGIEFDTIPSSEEIEEEIHPAIDSLEDLKEFPPRVGVQIENNPLRHKVILIEELTPSENIIKEEPHQDFENDVMVNDFEDTDYISFNDLLEGDLNGNEN